MRSAKGIQRVTSLVGACLLVGLIGSAGPLGCGAAGGGGAKTAAAVSGDIKTLRIFIVKPGGAENDPYVAKASASVEQAFKGAGYRIVEKQREADTLATIRVVKQEQQALFSVSINGKTKVNYKVSVGIEISDREGKEIGRVDGSYTSDEGEADDSEIASIVNKVTSSPVVLQYATSTKADRKAWRKKEAAAVKEANDREAAEEDRKAKDKAAREAKAKAEGTLRDATKLEKEINDIIRKAEGAVPDDKLKEFHSLIEKLKTESPGDASYYAQVEKTYILENTWYMPEKDGPAAIASNLGGDVVTSGANDGKKFSMSFNAKAGNCYTAFLRFKTPGGTEEIKDLTWTGKGGNTPLQRYHVAWGPGDYNTKGTQKTAGTCATKDTAVTVTADLTFAGTKNGLRYVVISHAKPKFPLYLATYLSMEAHDSCDIDAWAALWSDPIPGTLVYTDKEPFLISSPERAGQVWVSMWNATRVEVRSQKSNLSSTPPKKVKFGTQFRFPGCSKDPQYAEAADSTRFAKCHAAIDAKYQGQFDAAEKARDNAITYLAKRAAEAQINSLNEADERDREQQCAPIEKQIEKKWEAMFNKIVDSYTDSPKTSPIDRAGEMNTQDSH